MTVSNRLSMFCAAYRFVGKRVSYGAVSARSLRRGSVSKGTSSVKELKGRDLRETFLLLSALSQSDLDAWLEVLIEVERCSTIVSE